MRGAILGAHHQPKGYIGRPGQDQGRDVMGSSEDRISYSSFLRSHSVLLEIYLEFLQDCSTLDPFDKEEHDFSVGA